MENDSFQLIKDKLSRVPVSCYATLREIQVGCYALQVDSGAQSQENKPKAFFGFGAHSGMAKFSRETEDSAKKKKKTYLRHPPSRSQTNQSEQC